MIAAGNVVAYASDGSWFGFNQVAFNSNWTSLSVTYALGSSSPISLSVYQGSLSTTPVATVQLPPTGSWSTMNTVSIPWAPVNITQDVYVQFNGGGANVDNIQFTSPAVAPNLIQNGTFENGAGPWYTWNGGTMAVSTARAHSGIQSLLVTNRASNAPAATSLLGLVKPNMNYPFGLWVSINSSDGSSQQINVTLASTCQNADGSSTSSYPWIGVAAVPSGNTWTQISGTVAVPNCNLSSLQFYVEGGSGADLYVDDVQVLDNSNVCSPTNLLPDSNFENGIDGWTGQSCAATVTSSWFHSGADSLMAVAASASVYPSLVRDISSVIQPGQKYQVSAWVSGGTGGAWIQMSNNYGCSGVSVFAAVQPGAWVNGGTWSQITGTLDLTACPSSLWWAQIWVGGGAGNTFYVDDVTLTLIQYWFISKTHRALARRCTTVAAWYPSPNSGPILSRRCIGLRVAYLRRAHCR